MSRLPRFPDAHRAEAATSQLPDLAEFVRAIGEWGTDLVASQQRYNLVFYNDRQSRKDPPEPPRALSAQLNTTNPIYKPDPRGRLVIVTDASGGAEMAFGDTSAWRFVRTKDAV